MQTKLSYKCVKPHLNNLRVGGYYQIDPRSPKKQRILHTIYMRFSFIWIIIYTTQQAMKIYEVRHDIDNVIGNLFLFLTHTDSIYKQIVIWYKADQIEELLDIMRGPLFNQDEADNKQHLLEVAKYSKLLLFIDNFLALFTCFLWVLYPLVLHLQGKPIEFAIWLPYDVNVDTAPSNPYGSVIVEAAFPIQWLFIDFLLELISLTKGNKLFKGILLFFWKIRWPTIAFNARFYNLKTVCCAGLTLSCWQQRRPIDQNWYWYWPFEFLQLCVQFFTYISAVTDILFAKKLFYFTLLYVWFTTSWLAFCNTSMDVMISFFYAQCKAQLTILRYCLETLTEKSKVEHLLTGELFSDIINKRFSIILRHHLQIVHFVNVVEGIFSNALAYQFLLSGWIICVSVYKMVDLNPVSVQFLSMVFYICCMLIQIFMFCYYGNELTDESEKLMESAYSMNWLETAITHQRHLIIFMEKVKQPIRPLAGGIIPLSNNTFVSIVKNSYSFYALLKNTSE